jgi:SagB-type dehydrogenase family enzyme
MRAYRFALFLAPLAVYLFWLLARLAVRRRPSRFEVSTGLSILLLLYFLIVVGTGMFWVAAQELPVFAWHYLAGYLLLLVTLAHVLLHWRSILLFLRQKAPRALVVAEGSRFRPRYRWLGFGLAGLAAGGVLFLAGMRCSSQRLTLTAGDEAAMVSSGEGRAEGRPLDSRRLRAAPVTVTLAQMYHDGCSYPNKFNLPGLTVRAQPDPVKAYPGAQEIPLPVSRPGGGATVLAALQAWRSGPATSEPGLLSLEQLSLVLYHTQGVSKTIQARGLTFEMRTAASAGALYPVNLYVLAERVQGLTPGCYYYNPSRNALILVGQRPLTAAMAAVAGNPEALRSAPATIVLTATFARTAFKYGERSYRYMNMDTGHAAYNLALCAASLGLRAPMVGRFDDAAVNRLLNLDTAQEGTLLIQPLGPGLEPKDREPRFLLASLGGPKPQRATFLDLIHGGSSLRIGTTVGPRLTFDPDNTRKAGVALPEPAQGTPLYPTIRERRSVRTYAQSPLERNELSALCRAASGDAPGDPLLAGSAPLGLFLVVRNVRSLAPGVYRYLPGQHALEPVRAGDQAQAMMKACLEQDFCGTADVLFCKTISWEALAYPDGDRGYRYACLRAGFMGEGLYLQGGALGLGVCGVGAFEDAAVAKVLQLDPAREVCLYVTAVGRK